MWELIRYRSRLIWGLLRIVLLGYNLNDVVPFTAYRRSVIIDSSGNVTINQCSPEQVKLNFIQISRSTAETAFIVDNGRVFTHSQASRGMALSVQNGTIVLSNLVQGGMFTLMDSKTGKMLCEVNFTLIDSGTVWCYFDSSLVPLYC